MQAEPSRCIIPDTYTHFQTDLFYKIERTVCRISSGLLPVPYLTPG